MRIGIVGTGLIAKTNVEALQKTGRVEIAALCNRTLSKGEDFAKAHGIAAPVYATLDEMLEKEQLDAALINTPHAAHFEQFQACAQKGVHVLMEKPLGISGQECESMVALRDTYGIRAAVCHTQRYLPLMQAARQIIRDNWEKLGKLQHITDIINLHYFHDQRPAWFFDPLQAGGGLLMTHGAHQVDRVHVLGGGFTNKVFARMENLPQYPGLDSGYQMMGVAEGYTYTIVCAGYPSPHTSSVQMDFEKGSVKISLFANGMEEYGVYMGSQQGYTKVVHPLYEADAYVSQFDDMLDYLQGKPAGVPTLEEATQVLKVLDAMKASHQQGQAVTL